MLPLVVLRKSRLPAVRRESFTFVAIKMGANMLERRKAKAGMNNANLSMKRRTRMLSLSSLNLNEYRQVPNGL